MLIQHAVVSVSVTRSTDIFSYFSSKSMLWVFIRSVSKRFSWVLIMYVSVKK